MVNWTIEQQAAINARDSNLLVTAAAGSGKTAVLVQRVINIIIEDGVDIDKLLIVTFTRAAASEMKERIRKAIMKRLEASGGLDENLRRQIDLLGKAQISTIHSFCQSVVKNNFHLAEIDPALKVGEETEMLLLKTEAVEETLEREYAEGQDYFYEVLEMFSAGRDDRNLQDLILTIYDFIRSKPDPHGWLQEKTADFGMNIEGFAASLLAAAIAEQSALQLEGALELLQKAAYIAGKPGGPDHYLPVLMEDQDKIQELIEILPASLPLFIDQLLLLKFSSLKGGKTDCDVKLREEAKELRNEAKKVFDNIKNNFSGKSLKELMDDLNRLHPAMEYLEKLVIRFSTIYQNLKSEKGLLDFSDLEHLALKVLSHEKMASEYRQRFAYVFVDEYQDSNQVQEAIINLVKKDDNLFLVGDVKQSIYRFRLADPTLFMGKYHAFKDGEDEIDRRIFLRKNFRSTDNILAAVNYIFENIMSQAFGEIDYDSDAALYPGKDDINITEGMKEVELTLIDHQDPAAGEEVPEEIGELNQIQLEAYVAAARIKELLKNKIYDEGAGTYRDVIYKDIVILLRTNKNWIDVFTEVFTSEGIPSYADVNSGYLDAVEISMFINLLKIIDNPRQDIELISVLRSPVFHFNLEELAHIRLSSSNKSFYLALVNYQEEGELQQKINSFLEDLGKWQKMARYLPLEELIWQLMLETGYLYYVTAMPGGTQRMANIRLLFSKARNFETSTMHGLFSFLRFIEKISASQADVGTARTLGENDNVVRLMSIHKSKGLEFPIVILSGLGKQFNLSDMRGNILMHKDLGLGPRYVDTSLRTYSSTILRNAIGEKIKFENLSEEMRILYVAMTRAQVKLIMTGSVKNIEKGVKKWSKAVAPYNLAQARSPLDWLGMVLMRHEDGRALREISAEDWNSGDIRGHESRWQIEILNKNSIKLDVQKNTAEKEQLWQGLKNFRRETGSPWQDRVNSRLNWNYPYKSAGKIPVKLSVTQIQQQKEKNLSHGELNLPALIHHPVFAESGKGIKAVEKGTIIHFVLQHLDLGRVDTVEEILGQIQEMVDKQLLKPEEAAAVEIEKVLNFYRSALGQRALASNLARRETPFNFICKASEVLSGIADDSEEEMMVQGIIDLYFAEGDELVLVDYKTDYIDAENRQNKIDSYRIQIQLYKRALESILHKRVKESYLYFLSSNEAVLMGD